jgi:CRISPR-associated endoribonuclease Cas6
MQQAVIYNNLSNSFGLSSYIHNNGFTCGQKQFRLFTFGKLNGTYELSPGKICFKDQIWWEIRSPETFLIRMLAEQISEKGIWFGNQHLEHAKLRLFDETVEEEQVAIKMMAPICVYSTDEGTRKTYFYEPAEPAFYEQVDRNFRHKYEAYYGVCAQTGICMEPLRVTERDKVVTKYKNFYISGWKGIYLLQGPRKYLDFLYQTGLGSKNAQGFGMFEVLQKEEDE